METNHTDKGLLEAACDAWQASASLRKSRARNKAFTYGDQLSDLVTDRKGAVITEREQLEKWGRKPLTNNLLRQMVKSVVGHWRTRARQQSHAEPLLSLYSDNSLNELDSRQLEEFLISGCAIQKVEQRRRLNEIKPTVSNVNPNDFFINAILDPRAYDCAIIGQLHSWSIAELIVNLAADDYERAARLRRIYTDQGLNERVLTAASQVGRDMAANTQFWYAPDGRCRVIEVWTLEAHETLRCYDPLRPNPYTVDIAEKSRVEKENERRRRRKQAYIRTKWIVEQSWHCTWLSPMGDVLARYKSPLPDGSHPYVVSLYPLTDGEVHAFVEDVIDQQKYINRLISVVDNVIESSAKGVLLYPAMALPTGFTWEMLSEAWRKPNGIIPYDNTKQVPQQLITSGNPSGAHELLALELKLFEQISGVSNALQGRAGNGTTGAELFRQQTENSTIVLADVFDTFGHFTAQRDAKLLALVQAGNVEH